MERQIENKRGDLTKSKNNQEVMRHKKTYLLGWMLDEIGKKICQHVGSEGSYNSSTSKCGLGRSRISQRRLKALKRSVEKIARGIKQHG